MRYPGVQIDEENFDGSSANRGSANQDWSVPNEVSMPGLAARMKEPGELSRSWIEAGNV